MGLASVRIRAGTLALAALAAFAACGTRACAQEVLSPSIGAEIDAAEREAYGLFPGIEGFRSARIVRAQDGDLVIEVTIDTADGTAHTRAIALDSEELDAARVRVALIERDRASAAGQAAPDEARVLLRVAGRSLLQGRHDLARALFAEVQQTYPGTPEAEEARRILAALPLIEAGSNPLLGAYTGRDNPGRTDLLLFSGYYGLWLGIAAPVALDAHDVQWFAAGILLAPPASIYAAHILTKDRRIPEGTATIVTLGGHLGTWQGLGWSLVSDVDDGRKTTGHAALGGLAGVGLAAATTRFVDFSEGHAAVTDAGLLWGSWYGLAAVLLAKENRTDDEWLTGMLIGSDAAILAGGVLARNVRISETRMRWINLSGVLGGVAGFGTALLFDLDRDQAGVAMAAAGSTAGLALGVRLTRNLPPPLRAMNGTTGGRNPWDGIEIPMFSARANRATGRLEPTLGFRVSF